MGSWCVGLAVDWLSRGGWCSVGYIKCLKGGEMEKKSWKQKKIKRGSMLGKGVDALRKGGCDPYDLWSM